MLTRNGVRIQFLSLLTHVAIPIITFLTRKMRIGAGIVPQFLHAYGASMYVTSGRTQFKAWAPAKLNLFLEVLGRRTDGFHELDTLMLPISMCDTLVAESTADAPIRLHAEWAERRATRRQSSAAAQCGIGQLPKSADNLVYRAFELVRRRYCDPQGKTHGAVIHLTKRIPTEAGLGGGSSDAATALVLANRIWDLHLSFAELTELAAELGSDVPFFLYSTPCVCKGRGEIVTSVSTSSRVLHFVVVRPPEGLSTAKVFAKTEVVRRPRSSKKMVKVLSHGSIDQIGDHIFNRLQTAAFGQSEWINRLACLFERADVVAHQMTGSGSCYFGLCRSAKHATQLAGKINSQDSGIAFAVNSVTLPSSRRLHDHPGLN